MEMTQHTLTYIHKRRGFCKAGKAPEKALEPEQQKPITKHIAHDYIKQNHDIISIYEMREQ